MYKRLFNKLCPDSLKMLCPVAFRRFSPSLVGRIARYAPSSTCENRSKIDRPGINIFCGTGSKILNYD